MPILTSLIATLQVEFSNVVVLNKTDLVSEEQQGDILDRISLLNPKARYLYDVRKTSVSRDTCALSSFGSIFLQAHFFTPAQGGLHLSIAP